MQRKTATPISQAANMVPTTFCETQRPVTYMMRSVSCCADAPEIDGVVILPGITDVQPGDFVEVTITAADEHDLWGEPC